jgi:bile acid transporter
MLGGFEKALLGTLVLVLMAGMGATLTVESFRAVLRRPRGILIGLASQFGWMPAIAWALALIFGLPSDLAIGLVVVGCTPGGTTSNLFTYYSRADLALSIGMTTVSTVAAVVLMPLVLWIYATPFTSASLTIPFGSIVQTLLVVLVPVGIGMAVRARSERAAHQLETVGSGAGIAVLVLLVVSAVVRNSDVIGQLTGGMVAAAVLLGAAGITMGYGAAALARLSVAQRRAVALETGIQNSPLALALIIATFPEGQQARMLWLPMLYALCVLVTSSLVALYWRRSSMKT